VNQFSPKRIQREFTQTLNSVPEKIIPLLAPRKEELWATGWQPKFIYESDGPSEQGNLFSLPREGKDEVWLMTRHDLASHRSEFVRFFADIYVCEIEIQLALDGARTKSYLMYRYTGLSPAGNAFIEANFTKESFEAMAVEWENELNEFLRKI